MYHQEKIYIEEDPEPFSPSSLLATAETVFKEKHGVWDPMLKLTVTYLIVNSVVSYPPPTTKGKGSSGEDLSYLLSKFICLQIFKTTNREKGKGEGGGRKG